MPSRRRQISATACRLATASNVLANGARRVPRTAPRRRSVASGLISTRRSPPIASGSREVASTRRLRAVLGDRAGQRGSPQRSRARSCRGSRARAATATPSRSTRSASGQGCRSRRSRRRRREGRPSGSPTSASSISHALTGASVRGGDRQPSLADPARSDEGDDGMRSPARRRSSGPRRHGPSAGRVAAGGCRACEARRWLDASGHRDRRRPSTARRGRGSATPGRATAGRARCRARR